MEVAQQNNDQSLFEETEKIELDNQTRSTQFLNHRKNIQCCVLDYLESETDGHEELKTLKKSLDQEKFYTNHKELFDLLFLISKIIKNHHRLSDFFQKIEQILFYLSQIMPELNPDEKIKIFCTFKNERQYLILLFRTKILMLNKNGVKDDQNMLKIILNETDNQGFKCCYYLYPEIKSYLNKRRKKKIIGSFIDFYTQFDSSIIKFDNKEFKSRLDTYEKYLKEFQEKCFIGENDSYLCKLIRDDAVKEFIIYVNKNNISLQCNILPNKYETNAFLIEKKKVSLIEYSVFYGSIQIFNFLRFNGVYLEPSLWLYSIHGKNAEIIHILEENDVLPEDQSYKACLIESIKCHHNDISNYIRENLLNEKIDNILLYSFGCYNYSFFPENFKMDESKANLSLFDIITPSAVIAYGNNQSDLEALEKNVQLASSPKYNSFYLDGCSLLTHVLSPNSFKSLIVIGDINYIPNNLFYKCKFLTQIILPSTLTSIKDSTFFDCSSLEKITLPESLISIGHSAFRRCRSLKHITIPSSVASIKIGAFIDCSSLEHITLPPKLTLIERSVFIRCTSLAQITLPSSLTSIEDYVFRCTSLKEIIIPSSVKSIGRSSFKGCTSLTKIIIPSSVTLIEKSAFCKCTSLTHVTIPSSVESIGSAAFRECISLTKIIIPKSVTSIGNYIFEKCTSLKQITILSFVKSIGHAVFRDCISLKELIIPSTVTSIEYDAFYNCTSLKQITVLSSVIIFKSYIRNIIENYELRELIESLIMKFASSDQSNERSNNDDDNSNTDNIDDSFEKKHVIHFLQHLLLLDEKKLASQEFLQFCKEALEYGIIYNDNMHKSSENIRLIAKQNPNKRIMENKNQDLYQKFTSEFNINFQVINFLTFTKEKLLRIARGLARVFEIDLYDKFIEDLVDFQMTWSSQNDVKCDIQCFTVWEISETFHALSEKNNVFDTIMNIYGARYPKEKKNKLRELFLSYDSFKGLKPAKFEYPVNFPNCFHNKSLEEALKAIYFSFSNKRNVLLTGTEGSGITQLAKWVSRHYNSRNNNSENESTELFWVCTEETECPYRSYQNHSYNIDPLLTEAVQKGLCVVFDSLNDAPSTVIERLEGLIDVKYDGEKRMFQINKDLEGKSIEISKDFRLLCTCRVDKINEIPPEFVSRFDVIFLENQLDDINNEELKKLIEFLMTIKFASSSQSNNDNDANTNNADDSFENKYDNENACEISIDYDNDKSITVQQESNDHNNEIIFEEFKPSANLINLVLNSFDHTKITMYKLSQFCKAVSKYYYLFSHLPNNDSSSESPQKSKVTQQMQENIIKLSSDLVLKTDNFVVPKEIEDFFIKELINANTNDDGQYLFKESPQRCAFLAKLYAASIINLPLYVYGEPVVEITSAARAFGRLRKNVTMLVNQQKGNMQCLIHSFCPISMIIPNDFHGKTLTTALQKGCMFIADKMNLAPTTIIKALLPALEPYINEKHFFSCIGESIKIHPDFFFIACQNELGTFEYIALPSSIASRFRILYYQNQQIDDISKNSYIPTEKAIFKEEDALKYKSGINTKLFENPSFKQCLGYILPSIETSIFHMSSKTRASDLYGSNVVNNHSLTVNMSSRKKERKNFFQIIKENYQEDGVVSKSS